MTVRENYTGASSVRGLWRSDAAWLALWSAPFWSSVVGRVLKKHTAWFVDYASMVCGTERSLAHLPIYGVEATCPHLEMSSYVYPPWIAWGLAGPLRLLGETGLLVVYTAVFAAAFVFLLWVAFVRRGSDTQFAGVDRRLRWAFLAFLAGSPVVVGNVATIAQAGVVAAALFAGPASLTLVGTVVLVSLIKPIYLTYLAVPAFAAVGVVRRITLIVLAVGITVGLVSSNLPELAAWRAYVVSATIDPSPGGGFLRWLSDIGVHDHQAALLSYGVYAAVVFASGLVIADRGGLGREGRMWLGASCALLLMPRLIAYDLMIVGIGFVATLAAARRISDRAANALRALWIAACSVNLAANLIGGSLRGLHSLALLLLAAGLVAVAFGLLRTPLACDRHHSQPA